MFVGGSFGFAAVIRDQPVSSRSRQYNRLQIADSNPLFRDAKNSTVRCRGRSPGRRGSSHIDRIVSSVPPPEAEPVTSERPSVLSGQRVAFTGTLASMTHQAASEVVRDAGGEPTEHVSRSTTLLVIGEEGWPLESDGRISQKLQEAERLRQTGSGLRLASESEFLRIVGLVDEETTPRLYTPAMLSRLLKLSAGLVRRWERLGVLVPKRKVGRLPYFDFREVSRLRRITELLDEGITLPQLEQSLRGLAAIPDSAEIADQLELIAGSRTLVVRDSDGLMHVGSGQRILDFDPPDDAHPGAIPFVRPAPTRSAVDWYERACDLHEAGDLHAASEAFRKAILERPQQPEFHFQLAETLFRLGEADRALERYLCATDWDSDYVEAWGQIGVIHLDRREPHEAREALERAVDLSQEFADGHFHLGEAMHDLGDRAAARRHLRRYLTLEDRGPWADLARQKLALLEQPPS